MQSTVFYVESARHFILNSNELPANLAYTDSTVVLRNSYYNRICLSASSSAGSLDLDAGSAPVTQICGGHYGLVGNGYAPVGVSYNSNDNIGRLSLGAGTSWDLEGRQPGTGLSYIYPLTGIAQHVSTYQTGSLTLTAAMLGVVPFTGSSPATFTLPTISAASEKTSLVGITYEIVNSGSATLTIATDGTQVLNGIAGKTSTTLSAGQVLRIVAVQTGSSTFGWLATPGGTLN
jgi:hypothetical protein